MFIIRGFSITKTIKLLITEYTYLFEFSVFIKGIEYFFYFKLGLAPILNVPYNFYLIINLIIQFNKHLNLHIFILTEFKKMMEQLKILLSLYPLTN